MKIGVDAGCLGVIDERLKVGVYNVVKNVLLELSKIDSTNTYYLYSFYPIDKLLLSDLGIRMKNVVIPSKGWLSIWLPLFLIKDKIDVFLAASQAVPLRIPFFSKYKTVGIVYDIAYEKFPTLYSYTSSVNNHSFQSKSVAKESSLIIAISQNTKNDLVDMYKVNPKKIIVAYPGLVSLGKEKPYFNKYPYFLFVGALKKIKNVSVLLKAFQIISQKIKASYDLLIVGGDKWFDQDISGVLSTYPNDLKKKVKFLGTVESGQLISLYKSAVAFVSPSLYEGFGLPFIEAMSLSCPVIGSTAGSLPEIIGDAGILIDPGSASELAHAMEMVSINKNMRKDLIEKGKKQVKKYSWRSFANTIKSAIEYVYAKNAMYT